MLIGHKIKNLRENRKLSQDQMADLLDISQKQYSFIESNHTKITFERLQKIAQALKLNDDEYFDLVKQESMVLNITNNNDHAKGYIHAENYYEESTQKEIAKSLKEISSYLAIISKK
ncbi:MAG: helix-turn-helix transcriptional regulator [Chitinophagales bacterium]